MTRYDAGGALSQAADDAVARLRLVREATLATLRDLLAELDGGDLLSTTAESLRTASVVLSQIDDLLAREVPDEVAHAAEDGAVDAARAIVGALGDAPQGFAPDARAALEQAVTGRLDEVAAVFGEAAADIRQAIDEAIATGGVRDALVARVASLLDVSFRAATSAVDAAVMAAGRRALSMLAGASQEAPGPTIDDEPHFLYLGPLDAKTRPFCREHVGKVFPLSSIREMDNGQGLDVLDYCGGYNCRHLWSPITLEDARAEGYEVAR